MSDDAPPPPIARVTVVGCGLIGGSVALAAAEAGAHVTVHDVDPATRAAAAERGLGTVAATLGEAVSTADLVVLGVPVTAVAPTVAAVDAALRRPAVVTDVGSVKASVVRAVGALDLRRARFVGGHPMAGSEHRGIDHADATLFQGATWVLTPTVATDPGAFDRLGGFLRALGTRVLSVDPDVHDRLVAVASHLPQVLATTLMASAADVADTAGDGVLALAAGGFRDATRVAASDPDLWSAILTENRDAVLRAIEGFERRLDALRAALEAADADLVRDLLTAGRRATARLPGKVVEGVLVDLVVPVDDTPGALLGVTTVLGEAGVNIEDLAMRHASDGTRGALVVGVVGHDRAERARALLAARGIGGHLERRAGS